MPDRNKQKKQHSVLMKNVNNTPKKDLSSAKGFGLFAGLDVGTEKVCCAIGSLEYVENSDGALESSLHVLGVGQEAARGIGNHGLTNIEALEDCIASVVGSAEKAARKNIKDVYVNLPISLAKVSRIKLSLSLSGQTPVQSIHLRKLFGTLSKQGDDASQQVIHLWPLSYQLDDITNIGDPVGMIGKELSASCLKVSVSQSYLTNLAQCIGRCNLDVAGFVVDGYADGLACLVEEEADLGVTIIDIGGRTTQISCFMQGNLVWMDSIPIGGFHVTSDLARGLTTPIVQAERMKILYGNLNTSNKHSAEQIPLTQLIEQKGPVVEHVPCTVVQNIIEARVDELFDMIIDKTQSIPASLASVVLQKIVLTGGGASLQGLKEFAEKKIRTSVRIGVQSGLRGVNTLLSSPTFSTCAGLLRYAVQDYTGQNRKNDKRPLTFWQKISLWFNENV